MEGGKENHKLKWVLSGEVFEGKNRNSEAGRGSGARGDEGCWFGLGVGAAGAKREAPVGSRGLCMKAK